MAVDKLVDSTQLDADLTSVANAIRAKSGGSGQLAFPAGFVSEIGSIPSGGGGYTNDDFGDPTKPVGAVTISASIVGGQVSFTSRNYLLYNRTGVTSLSLPNAQAVPDSIAAYTTDLISISAPNAIYCGAGSFQGCSALPYAILPACAYLYTNCFATCRNLLAADFGGTPSSGQGLWRSGIFSSCNKLSVLVLRGNAVWALHSIGVFSESPFASGKAGGTLYVPASLISSYQSASNWSTILGYSTNSIKSIESTATDPNAPLDLTTHYADGTTIS